jgi:hypothetical protein
MEVLKKKSPTLATHVFGKKLSMPVSVYLPKNCNIILYRCCLELLRCPTEQAVINVTLALVTDGETQMKFQNTDS